MGCCQSTIESNEVEIPDQEKVNIQELNLMKTDDDFSEVSLNSHQDPDQFSKLCDSIVYNTRSTSISFHRIDLENAFLQTSSYPRRNTLDYSKQEPLDYIQEFLLSRANNS
jgi:hypothetical protein